MTAMQTIKKMIDEIKEPCEIMVLDRYLKEAMSKLGVSKSKGNPVGEYAEYLAATAFNGARMSNAKEGHDLTLPNGTKVEVKGRIFEAKRVPMTYIKHSTISSMTFDYLIYIVFDETMRVKYAMKISHSNFKVIAKYVEPINAPPKWVFVAKPALLVSPHVLDITNEIRKVESRHNACLASEQNNANYETVSKICFHSIVETPSFPLQSDTTSASDFSQKVLSHNSKDTSKFKFDGRAFGKGRLVLAVINKYAVNNPSLDFKCLLEAFPKRIQGSLGVFDAENRARELEAKTGYKRYFTEHADLLTLADDKIAVCNQWNTNNIRRFINRAKELGYQINDSQ